MSDRLDQLRSGLSTVEERIATACADAGRERAEVSLIVVTKTWPASDVRLLADLGVTDVAENKQQELTAKHEELAGLPLTWHFVGQLQSNKAGAVAAVADVVHSVDRVKLLGPMDRRGRPIDVLLQVSLDPPGGQHRAGAALGELPALAAAVLATDHLTLRGLMAVAPLGEDPAAAFARLAEIRAGFLETCPSATWLSAGMSGDLEHAVRAGATHVRVGSAVLGSRPPVQ
ncbi:YggS family pyridoxal phosphate-dependent enzyme [Nocardioides sp.]|uniref:YggS family pyridoxal phosphate-dependent enzyme n=1 Tax=Nocardioides sp. TaxID=35761 RepID=UPI001A20FA00|nr:YggS family pyridoxal phosphate-dependent enzyme [Nocardioides sp.]MBJ7357914.1 YggS family pyridoxal phosphate-dependent enzyme [Nocardioides sp.]